MDSIDILILDMQFLTELLEFILEPELVELRLELVSESLFSLRIELLMMGELAVEDGVADEDGEVVLGIGHSMLRVKIGLQQSLREVLLLLAFQR